MVVEHNLMPDCNPAAADFDKGALDRGPGNAMGRLLPARIVRVRGKGVVECLAVDVLGMGRQVRLHRSGKIVVGQIWHGTLYLDARTRGGGYTL